MKTSKKHKRSVARRNLEEREKQLLNELVSASEQLENVLSKNVKIATLIGVSLLAGYSVYKLFEKPDKKKKGKASPTRLNGISKAVLSQLMNKALPMAMDLLKKEKKDSTKIKSKD